MRLKGGSINAKDLEALLHLSYQPELSDYDNYKIDKELSGFRVKVYTKNNKAYIVHRGTKGFQDIMTDAKLGFNYKGGKRFKHAERIQKLAEDKYGKDNTYTFGHSLGSTISNEVGKDSKEIINLNRPVLIQDIMSLKPYNSTDITTTYDPISILKPFETKNGKEISIDSTTWNPLKEHKTTVLNRLDDNMIIGNGLNKSKWIQFVKHTQSQYNVSYKEALQIASKNYKK